ncbi:MAG TPA: tRNA pseudouridine(38-40) synthase TruA [Ghiorsea sp.]|nr:tRNA pseudouridine(38-40) synthase TruA [Ghiorsea sp.]
MMIQQRLAMVIEFNGAKFHGWQRQDNAFTVQEAMEDAMLKLEGKDSAPSFAAAGRTDTGVHATHMLIHADVKQAMWAKSPHAYIKGLNYHLRGAGVLVHGIKAVSDEFHARFDCFERRYQYKIWNRSVSSALYGQQAWWVFQLLDVDKMNQAAAILLGKHDFTTFRAAGCQANAPERNLKVLEVKQEGHFFTIDVAADAFLYHMVRNIVGSLVAVGIGRWQPEYMQELLDGKNRCVAAQTAPAHGLYFTDAIYPDFSAQDISGLVG